VPCAWLQGFSPLGLGGETLESRETDPEGRSRLGLGHASLESVYDLLREVFGVRFHRSILPCSPSSSQHAVKTSPSPKMSAMALSIEGPATKSKMPTKMNIERPRVMGIAIPLTFQNGRVSYTLYARFKAFMSAERAAEAAQIVKRMPKESKPGAGWRP
jgi:hypothetical protein